MSKRKNPLQNLDDFLKQEASSLVTPKKFAEPKPEPVQVTPPHSEKPGYTSSPQKATILNEEVVVELIQKLANKNNISVKHQLFELVRHMLEENGLESSKDKMLINTILYLQHDDNWREKVAEYWEKAAI